MNINYESRLVRQATEKSNEYQLDLCINDVLHTLLKRKHLSIEHSDLFQALSEIDINEGHFCILEDIYTNTTAHIHLDSDIFEIVKISKGV